MPGRMMVDDDEQQIADIWKELRRLRARLATGQVRGTHDQFVAAATPQTTYTLTYIPVDGTCAMYVNGLEQTEGTDYTVDYSTGIATFVTALTTGDQVDFRYLITDWLVARSLTADTGLITFIASTSSASSTSGVTSKTLATPTCQVGDTLFFAIESFLAAPSSAPTGWTLIPGVTGRSFAGADSSYLNVYQRTADSTDAAGTTYTVSFGTTTPTCIAMLSYRGVTAVDVSSIVTRTTEDAGADTASVTTTQDNDVVLSIFGRNYTSSVNAANSAPTGTTARAEAHTTAFDGILVVDETKATAGATTSRHMTAASNGVFVSAAIALKGP